MFFEHKGLTTFITILFLSLPESQAFATKSLEERVEIKIHPKITEFKEKTGLTGRGVKIGVLDQFKEPHAKGYPSHGEIVVQFLKAIAPEAIVTKQETVTSDQAMKNFVDLKTRAILKSITTEDQKMEMEEGTIRLLRKDKTPEKLGDGSPGYKLSLDYASKNCHQDKFDNVKLTKGQKLVFHFFSGGKPLQLVEEWFAEVSINNVSYYISFPQLTDSKTGLRWMLTKGTQTRSFYDSQFAFKIRHLMTEGINIINYSAGFGGAGKATKEAIKDLGKKGGVFVKAAGNVPVEVGKDLEIKYVTHEGQGIGWDAKFQNLLKSDACIVVGGLKTATEIAEYSPRAGDAQKRFIATVVKGTLEVLEGGKKRRIPLKGTSISAPQISGTLALLQEAYPKCSPKTLANAVLKTAGEVFDPLKGVRQNISLDLQAAYDLAKSAEYCKANPVVPSSTGSGT